MGGLVTGVGFMIGRSVRYQVTSLDKLLTHVTKQFSLVLATGHDALQLGR